MPHVMTSCMPNDGTPCVYSDTRPGRSFIYPKRVHFHWMCSTKFFTNSVTSFVTALGKSKCWMDGSIGMNNKEHPVPYPSSFPTHYAYLCMKFGERNGNAKLCSDKCDLLVDVDILAFIFTFLV